MLTAPLGWATAPVRARLFGADSCAPPRYKLPSVFLTGDIPGDEDVLVDPEPDGTNADGVAGEGSGQLGLGSPS